MTVNPGTHAARKTPVDTAQWMHMCNGTRNIRIGKVDFENLNSEHNCGD